MKRRDSPRVCDGAWHAGCYRQHSKDPFPVLNASDLDTAIINDEAMEEEDPRKFQEGRDGDHLMCPFICDECHFWNLRGRAPNLGNIYDELTQVCIRRAILDGFWARERSTVNGNRREGIRYLSQCENLGEENPYPARGPWPQRDVFGMKMAATLLLRSLDKGKNAARIQFDTLRKMRSHLSNFAHTTPGGVGPTFIGDEGNVSAISRSDTNSMWFRRFMQGMHKRMGDVWIPDRPLTITEVLRALEMLEEDWRIYFGIQDMMGLSKTGLTMTMIVAGFFGALRGEEVCKIDVGTMREHWKESTGNPMHPHVPLMMAGKFKRETGIKLFCQPLAMKSNSGVDIASIFYRTLGVQEKLGITHGPLFRTKGKRDTHFKPASVGDLDMMFRDILKRIQRRWPNVIPESVKVDEDFSMSRSPRRGSTAEAQNQEIPKEVIEANNRWRKRMRSKGLTPGMSMMERYTDAKASVKALTRYSRNL